MSRRTSYFPGGYEPAQPNGNISEVWDDAAGTYTRYNPDGTVAETRPLTADEQAALTAADAADKQDAAVAQAQTGINGLYAQASTFQSQLQADLTAVQGGWGALTADQQTAIMGRILNGFATVMQGLTDHCTVTGAITPQQ